MTGVRRRRRLLVAVVVAVLAGLGACRTQSADPGDLGPIPETTAGPVAGPASDLAVVDERYLGSGPRVAVLGDGLLWGTRDLLGDVLEGYSVRAALVATDGFTGGPVSDAEPDLGAPALARDLASGGPEVAVVVMGTADAVRGGEVTIDDVRAGMDAVLGPFAETCLVTVTIPETDRLDSYDAGLAAQINERIRAAGDSVFEWQVESRYPGRTRSGSVAPSDDGHLVLTAGIAAAVEGCRPAGETGG